MSFLNKIFQSIPVKIPDRSGFDLSHEVLSTAKVGTVTPVTHFEVLPGDTISMGSLMKVTLPPMAVPFMGRIDAELTAAFIPYRLLWQGWQSFITQNNGFGRGAGSFDSGSVSAGSQDTAFIDSGINENNVPYCVPTVEVGMESSLPDQSELGLYYGPGSLADYLGYKRPPSGIVNSSRLISALPFLAYHKFCDDWIRDDNNMKPFFPKVNAPRLGTGSGNLSPVVAQSPGLCPFYANDNYAQPGQGIMTYYPYSSPLGTSNSNSVAWPVDQTLRLGKLRQRCWAKDYFTTATTRPQAGAAASVTFDTSGLSGSFTIATLRAANSLQKWMERNNIAGTEYGDQIMSHFGVRPPDAVLNRSILLGSVRTPVYVGSVENNTGTGQQAGTNSPFGNTLGAAAGFASGTDRGSLVDNFTAKEHGVIMVFFTLIPHAYYNSGVDRQLLHLGIGDFAFPEFANIGDQEIRTGELTVNGGLAPGQVFGYNQRYSEYKFIGDRISGFLRDGENMDVYALQRGFDSVPVLGKDFLEIPTDYLDQVLGVSSELAGFGCMIDCYFNCRALRVLPEYSLPSL